MNASKWWRELSLDPVTSPNVAIPKVSVFRNPSKYSTLERISEAESDKNHLGAKVFSGWNPFQFLCCMGSIRVSGLSLPFQWL
jgi:hypothetical protein